MVVLSAAPTVKFIPAAARKRIKVVFKICFFMAFDKKVFLCLKQSHCPTITEKNNDRNLLLRKADFV